MNDRLEVLRDKERRAEEGGGTERRDRQHKEGKLSANILPLVGRGNNDCLRKIGQNLAPDDGNIIVRITNIDEYLAIEWL